MKKLFLDDERTPATKDWDIVRSYKDAVEWVEKNGCPDIVSFDHDLGAVRETGMTFAHYLVKRDLDAKGTFLPRTFQFLVHSANIVGEKNIRSLITQYLKERAAGNIIYT